MKNLTTDAVTDLYFSLFFWNTCTSQIDDLKLLGARVSTIEAVEMNRRMIAVCIVVTRYTLNATPIA